MQLIIGMRFARILVVCLFAGAGHYAQTHVANFEPSHAQVIQGIDHAQQQREERLAGYSVTEHYTIQNSRLNRSAETTVMTTYTKGAGKSYRVISKSGPEILQSRVLQRLLKEEVEMSRGEQRRQALFTSANYDVKLIGRDTLENRTCDVVELVPRFKSPHLLKGRAWVDAETYALVRIEGKLAASAAFLVGRPAIVREYTQIDGFFLARESRVTAETFLLGKTELTIKYTNYNVKRAATRSSEGR